MKFSGIDLHSNNSVVVISDEEDRIVYQKRLPNDLRQIQAAPEPYRAISMKLEKLLRLGMRQRTPIPGSRPRRMITRLSRIFYILKQNKYQIELLTNLDQVPEAGALVSVTWPEAKDGSGFPARVFAILP
jgi:hypothetical protein